MLIHYFLALAPGCHILITLGNMVTNMVQIRELTHFTIMTISSKKKKPSVTMLKYAIISTNFFGSQHMIIIEFSTDPQRKTFENFKSFK